MLRRYKRLYGSFLLVLSLLPVIISIVFIAKQQSIQNQMEVLLEGKHLTVITLQNDQLVWHKKDKELIINQELFDVKSIREIEDGIYRVTGLFDQQEKKLHDQVAKAVEQKETNGCSVLLKFFSFYAIVTRNDDEVSVWFDPLKHSSFCQNKLCGSFTSIIVPPPEIIVVTSKSA